MFNIGDNVKVLPPFDSGCPNTYQVIAYVAENNSYLLSNDIEFVAEYLEKV